VPESKREALNNKLMEIVEKGLVSADNNTQEVCARLIAYAPKDKISSLIVIGLASENAEVQKECARLTAVFVHPNEIPALIEKGFATNNIDVQQRCVRMIMLAPPNKRESLLQIAKEKMGDYLIEPVLYKGYDISDEDFHRTKLWKTGSETTILGGDLKGKTIIRHIEPKAFLEWQKLYEDHELWKNNGFDYVPIEPIQSFKLNNSGIVDVYSGVLDLSFGDWINMSGEFISELDQDSIKILEVLNKNQIVHGHPHPGNFCLRFFRNTDGKVDFSKKPRIYLIDFDQAVSP
jgi:hypothetical protein